MRLGKMLRTYRLFEGVEQKHVASEIGIAPSTLSSIESGKRCDLESFTKLLAWLVAEDNGKAELIK